MNPREKKVENLKKNASVRGCVGKVVGMCGVCLLLGLGVHGLGLLVCPPPGSIGPPLLRWQHPTVLSAPVGQPGYLRHDVLSNFPW